MEVGPALSAPDLGRDQQLGPIVMGIGLLVGLEALNLRPEAGPDLTDPGCLALYSGHRILGFLAHRRGQTFGGHGLPYLGGQPDLGFPGLVQLVL